MSENMAVTSETIAQDEEHGEATSQYLTFRVEQAEYGIELMQIREIRGWVETTRIPNASEHMRGVINLRGLVVPIFDLRQRFGGNETQPTESHVVIVIALEERTIGMLVDAVSDILTVKDEDIKAAPNQGEAEIDDTFVNGLLSVEEKMVVLLDIAALFAGDVEAEADVSIEEQNESKNETEGDV